MDSFIHEKLLLPPPAPSVVSVERLGVITNLDFAPPPQIELGILDIRIPYIREWLVDVSLAAAPYTRIFSNFVDISTSRIAFIAFDSNNNQDGVV